MLLSDLNRHLESLLAHGRELSITGSSPVSGGSINRAFRLHTDKGDFFLKLNDPMAYPNMFEAEADGLERLRAAGAFRIPEVIATGRFQDHAFIVMEFLHEGRPASDFWELAGQQLAQLHLVSDTSFGLAIDNYIGSLTQSNGSKDSWSTFFISQRLEPLVRRAFDSGAIDRVLCRQFEVLFKSMPDYFPVEPPSLLHGDLWSGNFMCTDRGLAAIYDPAVYFGHREMDLAMTKLFGGFPPSFYESYNQVRPLESGWEERLNVANLYPLLVHVILFGGSYVHDVKSILKRFVG